MFDTLIENLGRMFGRSSPIKKSEHLTLFEYNYGRAGNKRYKIHISLREAGFKPFWLDNNGIWRELTEKALPTRDEALAIIKHHQEFYDAHLDLSKGLIEYI